MSESLKSATNEVRKRAVDLVHRITRSADMAELKKLVAGLNTLEDLCNEPKSSLASLFSFGDEDSALDIAPDEFYGLDPLDAAKMYLKKAGRAGIKSAPFSDIVTAIRAGGGDSGNEDKLRISLARSTFEVVKIGDDRYGLVEFFDHVKRERGGTKKKKKGEPSDTDQDAGDHADAQASDAGLPPDVVAENQTGRS